ncbi:hypothetical protein BDP27DRAFT_1365262 [Rhodocollybia butyracea]|uniref:Hydrophobin n=1 Tax=Rhodocollybia butyracea TaxID=206335 RepID=A0A9P5PJV6_9AGAR|nr:hypothetical protein BDP27DRAFT_1365262 [Rhodocollybia butyracea]
MQFKLALVTAALATLIVANPTSLASSTCSTGFIQCCERTATAAEVLKTRAIVALLKRGGINTSNITGTVGFSCSSLNVPCGDSCGPAHTLCCTKSALNVIISVGCTPATTH